MTLVLHSFKVNSCHKFVHSFVFLGSSTQTIVFFIFNNGDELTRNSIENASCSRYSILIEYKTLSVFCIQDPAPEVFISFIHQVLPVKSGC